MPLLFSYGTLQEPAIQQATFGRLLTGWPDVLPGYQPARAPIRDPDERARSGKTHYANIVGTGRDEDRVPGMVFEVSQSELEAADEYEARADYERVTVTTVSGREVWVFRCVSVEPDHTR